jgi:hypothetical protein
MPPRIIALGRTPSVLGVLPVVLVVLVTACGREPSADPTGHSVSGIATAVTPVLETLTFLRRGSQPPGAYACALSYHDPLIGRTRVQEDVACTILDDVRITLKVDLAVALAPGQVTSIVTIFNCGSLSETNGSCGIADPSAVRGGVSRIDAGPRNVAFCRALAGAPMGMASTQWGLLPPGLPSLAVPVAAAPMWSGQVHNWTARAADDVHVTLSQYWDVEAGPAPGPVDMRDIRPPAASAITVNGTSVPPRPGDILGRFWIDRNGNIQFRGQRVIRYDHRLPALVQPSTNVNVTFAEGFLLHQVAWTSGGTIVEQTPDYRTQTWNPAIIVDHLFKGHIIPVPEGSNDWHWEGRGFEGAFIVGPGTLTFTAGTGNDPSRVDIAGVTKDTRLYLIRTRLQPARYWHTRDGRMIGREGEFG